MKPLQPNCTYHIYTHANGYDNLFSEDRDYRFFLDEYKKHIYPIAKTLAYCLMPNHLHLLVTIREEQVLNALINEKTASGHEAPKTITGESMEQYLSKQFANLFSSYTQAYNKTYHRKGSLFIKNFNRKKVTNEHYFLRLVNYIHFNSMILGFAQPGQWKYSSFNAIVKQQNTLVDYSGVLERFNGLSNFLYCHQGPMDGSFDY